jgi:hypothetical protein
MSDLQREIFICECHSTEHQMLVSYIEGEQHEDWVEEDLLTFEVHLGNYKSFWKRAWAGIKYIFGHTSRYGHWDSILFNPNDCERMIEFLEKFKKGRDRALAEYKERKSQNVAVNGELLNPDPTIAAERNTLANEPKFKFVSPSISFREID